MPTSVAPRWAAWDRRAGRNTAGPLGGTEASVTSMVVGGVTDTSARFVTKVRTGPVRIFYSTSSDMTSPAVSGLTAVDAQGVAKVTVTGLTADTRYYWRVEDNSAIGPSVTGQFRTHPAAAGQAASFIIGAAGCAGSTSDFPGSGSLDADKLSNSPIFDTIRAQALADEWLAFVHLGDLHYYNFGTDNTDTLANRRTSYDDVLALSRQHQLYRTVPWVYVWDDHDYAGDDSDGDYVDKANAAQVYRERVPHYDLAESSGPIYHSFQIGRVLFVVSDCRYDRSPNTDPDDASKTMLGAAQKAWLDNLLDTSTAAALVWFQSSQWRGGGTDTFASFTTERAELMAMLEEHGWLDKMCIVGGDRHALNIDDGTMRNVDHGGFPLFMFAPMDSTPNRDPTFDVLWSHGGRGGRGHYGTIRVDDNGTDLSITGTGYVDGVPWQWHTFSTGGQVAVPAGSQPHVLAL